MTAYALVTISLQDPETFAAYRELAGAALKKHNAEAMAVSKEAEVIEGTAPAPDVTVILTFPDRAHAKAWINDPELADVHALRQNSGITNIILM
ncbi:hypothetical protein NBRC116601_27090 [Cognatishimia sp. WU-CL00825]|uniref:DUF1330 domain-containing protein n=1 Tax=Cognatishimia sp. WU-CL00825 TaxID=3127658 RepID=UPI00310B473E